MKDMLMIPDRTGPVTFNVLGSSEDTGLLLYQRLLVLMMSNGDRKFGLDGSSPGFIGLLGSSNTLPDDALQSLVSLQCALALESLDSEDASHVESFESEVDNGHVTCRLTLVDGTTVTGELQ